MTGLISAGNPGLVAALPTDDRSRALHRIRAVVRLWEEAIRIPGLGWRVGLDPIVGLVPGLGDLVGAVVSLYPIVEAFRMGAGSLIVGRMLANVAIDAVVGAVPLLGDLFDLGWKANRRNHDLMIRWLDSPDRARRSTALALGVLGVGSAVLVVVVSWLVVAGFKALLG
jgi:hypothetical protein